MRYLLVLVLTLSAFSVHAEPITVEPLERCVSFADVSSRIENILKTDLATAMVRVRKLEAKVIALEEAARAKDEIEEGVEE